MKATRPSRAFEIMRAHGLLAITAPELLESVGCTQNRYHAYDVWGHALHCLDACPRVPVLRVAGLLHDVGKPRSRAFSEKNQDYTFYDHDRIGAEMVDPLLSRLRFSTDERERIVALVRHHIICYDAQWSDAAVRRWLRRVTPELAEELYVLCHADIVAKGREHAQDLANLEGLKLHAARVMSEGAAFGVKDLAVDGRTLMQELGLPPSRRIGDLLRELLEDVVENPSLNERSKLLTRAKSILERAPG
jgi:tRNA nucleotidyltransferase (CCA-adding enzyme)